MSEKPVKLLIAITKSNWGGAARYVYDIAKHFHTDKDFSVSVLAGGEGDLVKKLHKEGIRTLSLSSLQRDVTILADMRASYTLFRLLLQEKPDILHLNSSKMGLFGAFLGRVCGINRIIFTAHAWTFNEARPLYQRIIFRILALLTVSLSHETIAVSQSVVTTLKAPRFISKKISCVYTGIAPPQMYPDGLFFEKFGIQKTPGTNIVSVGELHTSKGYDRALIALAQCKGRPWTYHIMGTGEKKEYLDKLATSLGIRERIHFHGFVENASLYLNSFDLFLFPSRTEALGYVAIEALFSKIPIIASKAGGIPEVLFDDPYTKLIDCNNEKIFKEALISTLQKPLQVNENSRPGKLRFLQTFMFTATKKIYLAK